MPTSFRWPSFGYARLNRPDKGVVLRYLGTTCGYSRAQLLAKVDRAHGTLSGPATVHLLKRALHVHGDTRFERLAELSVSHLYNLWHSKIHKNQRVSFSKTRPVAIGLRRAPRPQGRPGFIRIDSMHQGGLSRQCRGHRHRVGGGGQQLFRLLLTLH